LLARGAITGRAGWFEEQHFVEVETGILQIRPATRTHLHAPRTELTDAGGERHPRIWRPRRNRRQETAGSGRSKDLRIRPRFP